MRINRLIDHYTRPTRPARPVRQAVAALAGTAALALTVACGPAHQGGTRGTTPPEGPGAPPTAGAPSTAGTSPAPGTPGAAYTDAQVAAASVTLSRTTCYGTCPVYEVTVHGDGRVEWDGAAFVEHTGKARKTIPAADAQRLIRKLLDEEIMTRADDYAENVVDAPAEFVTMRVAGREREFRVRLPRDPASSTPGDDVDRVAGTRTWIGEHPPTTPPGSAARPSASTGGLESGGVTPTPGMETGGPAPSS